MQLKYSCIAENKRLIYAVSIAEKRLDRLLSKPRDFSYDELKRLLGRFGYREVKKGKTSGSRVAFIHGETKHIIRLHRPHPHPNLKQYQLNLIIEALKEQGLIE